LIGDKPWRELLNEFYRRTREVLHEYRGREVSTAGDGFLATFEGPARAIRCANALNNAVRSLNLKVRCGIHTSARLIRSIAEKADQFTRVRLLTLAEKYEARVRELRAELRTVPAKRDIAPEATDRRLREIMELVLRML
jgi:hypothetical protein